MYAYTLTILSLAVLTVLVPMGVVRLMRPAAPAFVEAMPIPAAVPASRAVRTHEVVVSDEDIHSTILGIRRMGGRVVRSAPVGAGYHVTYVR